MTDNPSPLGRKFDTGVQAANTDIFTNDFGAFHTPGALRITVALHGASTVKVAESEGGNTVTYDLNGGATLDAGELNAFDVPIRDGPTYNIRLGSNVGIRTLNVDGVYMAEV